MLAKEVKISHDLTYSDWMERYQRLDKVKDLTGEKILYARSKNLMILRRFYMANNMESRIPFSPEFKVFQTELNAMRNKYIVMGQHGNQPTVDVNNPEYLDDLAKLQEKHKAAIEERERDYQMYNDFLKEVVRKEDVPLIFTTINDSISPLTQEQVDAVWWFVSERSE